ncbi:hypothetical protein MNBD_CHLOROFLEXI01-795, partial [hydrothermal vent metagenome]
YKKEPTPLDETVQIELQSVDLPQGEAHFRYKK